MVRKGQKTEYQANTGLRRDRYADRVWTRVGRAYPLTPEGLMPLHDNCLNPCVSVSTTGLPCPELEIAEVFGHEKRHYEVAEAILTLMDHGFIVDDETTIYAPGWFRRLQLESVE